MPDAEDFISPEVAVAVAVTSAVLHPTVRKTVRRGLILGLAGGLTAFEGVKGWANGFSPAPLAGGVPQGAKGALQDLGQEAQAVRGKGRNVRKKEAP